MTTPEKISLASDHRAGAGLELSFACPECEHISWVTWEHLGHGVRCAACAVWFALDRHGQLKSGKPLRHFQFKCPRCGEPGELPATRLAQGANCQACALPLLAGPDRKLHDEPELLALKRKSREKAQRERAAASAVSICNSSWMSELRLGGRRGVWMAVTAIAGILALGIVACTFQGAAQGETMARRFVVDLLAGQWDGAAEQVVEFQEDDFRRWCILHFASIRDEFRPKTDSVRIDVKTQSETLDQRILRVTLTSPFLGERTHVQCWRRVKDRWVFDAVASRE